MAQRISKKDLKHDEFVESAFDAGAWLAQHRREVTLGAGILVGVVVLAVAWIGWSRYSAAQSEKNLAEAMQVYEEGKDLPRAIGLFEDAAGSSPAGVTARYYLGAAQLKTGKAKEAAENLEKAAAASDSKAQADAARALAAQAHAAAGDLDKAAAGWKALADATGGTFPADLALVRYGDVLQKQGKEAEARAAWQQALTRTPNGAGAAEARSRLGLQAGAGQ